MAVTCYLYENQLRPIAEVGDLRFALLCKDEISEDHAFGLRDAGQLLDRLMALGNEAANIRRVLSCVLDALSPDLPKEKLAQISNEDLAELLYSWIFLPEAMMPPAAGSA